MGRQSRLKRERRKAREKAKQLARVRAIQASGGPKMIVASGGGADWTEEDRCDDCPICAAMREMGLGDDETITLEQFVRLAAAFREAEGQQQEWERIPGILLPRETA